MYVVISGSDFITPNYRTTGE